MSKFAIRRFLPELVCKPLWGDRQRWGLEIDESDCCWNEWQTTYTDFYSANQREGVGGLINDAGYKVMRQIDLSGKRVLEIGAGDIRHSEYWIGEPAKYVLADVHADMMRKAQERLEEKGVNYKTVMLNREQPLPLDDNSVDVIVSFYSLEHLYPLEPYLDEMSRVLTSGGVIIGAIPAEGGLAWGAGRFFTSRRWFKKNSTIDPDKIICWEHPNFADYIVKVLDEKFQREDLSYWPMSLPVLDINLVVKYKYIKA